MNQPIPGVAPSALKEVTVMTVWPTLSAISFGKFMGRLYGIDVGFRVFNVPVKIGPLIALASIPVVLPIYFLTLLPKFPFVFLGIVNPWCKRYRLTNRRVVVENGYGLGEIKSISLDRFDAIEVEVLPGQAWYPAGDLVFRNGSVETFRIEGVPRPETFRQTCLKAHQSFHGVQQAREMGVAI